ncbi:hypothetical protein SDC9_74331 [bioreactor metagenome]|uniref:Uncharacterized protein n=1 Tax=bioreactor metagenome TaxID=1076179 RepID=A0A644YHR2_9ZZZZ
MQYLGRCVDRLLQEVQAEVLVRGMAPAVLVGVGNSQGGNTENVGPHVARQASSQPEGEGDLIGVHFFQGCDHHSAHRKIAVRLRRVHEAVHRHPRSGGMAGDVPLYFFRDVEGVLVHHEPGVHLDRGFRGIDGLGALPLVAAGDSVDGERGQEVELRIVFIFVEAEGGHAVEVFEVLPVEGQPGDDLHVLFRGRPDPVHEPFDQDAALLVLHGPEQAQKLPSGVGYDVPAPAGMAVEPGGFHLDLEVQHTPAPQADVEHVPGKHGPVHGESDVAGQPLPVLFHEGGEAGAPRLLLSLEDELHTAGNVRTRLPEGPDGQDVGHELPLVVGNSPCV